MRASIGGEGVLARVATLFVGWTLGALTLAALMLASAPRAAAEPLEGIHKIQHVVVIMQENRSFDSYFGTYPGANGIPAGVCVPDPLKGGCVAPYHNSNDMNTGGPHGTGGALKDIDEGRMDGFIAEAEGAKNCTDLGPNCSGCAREGGLECKEVVGYHDARELANYWAYANNFVLQDNMFESAMAASLHSHGYLVSAWWARCPLDDANPLDCHETKTADADSKTRAWTDVTYLLARAHVSWRYYVKEGIEPDCESDEAVTCAPVKQNPKTPSIWNPLPSFTDVQEDGELEDIQSLNGFYSAVQEPSCGLPNVSWIAPSGAVSEHPPSLVSKGQTYVTTLINAVMRSPCWGSTAIFVAWDDWGGLYDHVVPPAIDKQGYGLRVPAFVVSPYARAGFIDDQQLSFDAYLKFIEDDFLASARLDPTTDGRPDMRPDVRERAPGLGDLAADFNFDQAPRPPLVLPAHPEAGPASAVPGGAQPPALETAPASSVGIGGAVLKGTVNPDGSTVTDCHFDYGPSAEYGSSAPCSASPGSGTRAFEVSAQLQGLLANTTYHYRIVATNAGGHSAGPGLTFTTRTTAPAAETLSATALTQTTATLNASVNPNGATVSDCRFEYGTSVFYEASIPCSSLPGSGTSPVAVSAQISGLSANTTYHFRILATNEGGTSAGQDASFATLPEAPRVTAVSPASGPVGGGTAITISGTNLGGASAVAFGNAPARSFTVETATSIVAVSPAEASGTVDVTVTTRGGTSAVSAADRFKFTPTVNSVSPNSGSVAGGTTVTITGSGFAPGSGATVFNFGATAARSVSCSSDAICTAVAPAHEAGTVDVKATVNKVASPKNRAGDGFTFTVP
jgi:phospholipase C